MDPRSQLKLQRDERIMHSIRHHWISFVLRAFLPMLAVAVGLGVLIGRILDPPEPFTSSPPLLDGTNLLLVFVIAIMFGIVAYLWFDWRNDFLIITNKRVVHEDRTLGFSYRYQTITLERVQNVNIQQNAVQKLLGYGHIKIQAAAPSRPIVFRRSDRPRVIQQYLLREIQREKRQQEKLTRDVVVQQRIDPSSVPPDPLPTPQIAYEGQLTWWQIVFPFAPIVQDGTITWHRHWTILLQKTFFPLIGLVALPFLVWLLAWSELLNPITWTVVVVAFVALLGYGAWQYDDWRNDVYVLEPNRVIDIERKPLFFYENRREAPLGVIQNVNVSSPNVWARIFGYGNVLIETAGSAGEFTFDHVPDPRDVQRTVFAYQERFRKRQRERELNATLDLVDAYLQSRLPGNQRTP